MPEWLCWACPDQALSVPPFLSCSPSCHQGDQLEVQAGPNDHAPRADQYKEDSLLPRWELANPSSPSGPCLPPLQWEHRFPTSWVEGIVQLLTSRWAHYPLLSCLIYSQTICLFIQKGSLWEFLGGPLVRTQHFHCQGLSSIPGQGTKIPQAEWCNQKEETKQRNQGSPCTLASNSPTCLGEAHGDISRFIIFCQISMTFHTYWFSYCLLSPSKGIIFFNCYYLLSLFSCQIAKASYSNWLWSMPEPFSPSTAPLLLTSRHWFCVCSWIWRKALPP